MIFLEGEDSKAGTTNGFFKRHIWMWGWRMMIREAHDVGRGFD